VERTPSPEPERTPQAPQQTGLKEELQALERVRRAIHVGDAGFAAAALARYWRRFPDGYLRPEAERLEQQLKAARHAD
jgi:hypothetical protein